MELIQAEIARRKPEEVLKTTLLRLIQPLVNCRPVR